MNWKISGMKPLTTALNNIWHCWVNRYSTTNQHTILALSKIRWFFGGQSRKILGLSFVNDMIFKKNIFRQFDIVLVTQIPKNTLLKNNAHAWGWNIGFRFKPRSKNNAYFKDMGQPFVLRSCLSTIPTYNSHFNSHLNSHFLFNRSGNSFLMNSHF